MSTKIAMPMGLEEHLKEQKAEEYEVVQEKDYFEIGLDDLD